MTTRGVTLVLAAAPASVRERAAGRAAVTAAAIVFFAALTAAAAQVSIPLPGTPVPLTLQPMIVVLAGAALGARAGTVAETLYLLAGVVGLPVFAASPVLPQGAARLLGPTGGYLLSYPFVAALVGALADRGLGRRYAAAFLSMVAGVAVVYAGGVSWFAIVTPPTSLSPSALFGATVRPFLLLDLVKAAAAAALIPAAWRWLGRNQNRRP